MNRYSGYGGYDKRNVRVDRDIEKIVNEIKRAESYTKIKPDSIVTWGKTIADKIRKVKTHQIRRIFSEIKRLHYDYISKKRKISTEEIKERLIFLKPLLAYAENRESKISPFCAVLEASIDKISKEANENNFYRSFDRFVKLCEAVIAYHKEY